MKKCPACAYGNPPSSEKCCVCGRPLAGVPDLAPPAPPASSPLMPAAFAALLLCAGLFWLLQRYAWRPLPPAPPAGDDPAYSYAAAAQALEGLGRLRYLPDEDREAALRFLSAPDERGPAAARAAGAWLRGLRDGPLARRLLGALLDAAAVPGPAGRAAAMEAGMALLLGLPAGPDEGRAAAAAAALAARPETDLRAAGFFLSAMAGRRDLAPQMLAVLRSDPSAEARLYAACALSRLGESEAYAALEASAQGRGPGSRYEALACLAYSASPGADRLLEAAAAEELDAQAAESARNALILRGQLAIIKKVMREDK